MPSYVSDEKLQAREWMARWYLERTKGPLPARLQYWTLCCRQSTDARCELLQLSGLGLFSKEQFVGVDLDSSLVEANRQDHPEATWHCGDWEEVLHREHAAGRYRPGLVHLDTLCRVGSETMTRLLRATMVRTPAGVPVVLNVISGDMRSKATERMDVGALVCSRLSARECRDWGLDGPVPSVTYKNTGSIAEMTMLMLVRKGEPCEQSQA